MELSRISVRWPTLLFLEADARWAAAQPRPVGRAFAGLFASLTDYIESVLDDSDREPGSSLFVSHPALKGASRPAHAHKRPQSSKQATTKLVGHRADLDPPRMERAWLIAALIAASAL